MAIYRNVSLTFWEDNKVVDDFTAEDKYFLLYLLTNPHTNIIGCYEISIKQMSNELGSNKNDEFNFNENKVEELLIRMEQIHKVIFYAKETKEILIKNWHKYNWTKSEKLKKSIMENIKKIKSEKLKKYMVSIGYIYGMHTTDTDTDSDSDSDTVSDSVNNIFSFVEEKFGRTMSSTEYEEIKSWVSEDISEELIVYATKIAVENKACSVKYIGAILNSWKLKKVKTLKQAEEANQKFTQKKSGPTPEWFDKDIKAKESSAEEKKKIEELLKEFK